MFKKKKPVEGGSVLSETYVPATLPKYGLALDTFRPGGYRLLSNQFIQNCYEDCEKALSPLVQTSDRFTVGTACDAYVDGQIAHLEAIHREDSADRDMQAENIRSARAIRMDAIDRRLTQLEQNEDRLTREISPLKDLKAQFELQLGRHHIPIGQLITFAAMIMDAFLNFSFLSGILPTHRLLLILTVICMSVMSDASMCVLGSLLSRKDEDFMPKWLMNTCIGGLLGMFLLSVLASIFIRFGTMPETFLVPDAEGNLLRKEVFSLADWGVTIMTSFLTTATGLISLAFSVDKNAHLVDRCRSLQAELAAVKAEQSALTDERNAISRAADPSVWDLKCRRAAEDNLAALCVGLKQHMRKLLALHQSEASYTDSMAESARALLPLSGEGAPVPGSETENLTFHTNCTFEEAV